jgi:processive 1,2-diacylglycerol beta-glucosyltransferase
MAASALAEAFAARYPQTEVLGINLIKYTNPLLGAAATRTYLGLIRNNPSVWRYFYDNLAFKEKTEKLRDVVHLSSYIRLRKIMDDFEPDIVVCTQAFPCIIVDKYKAITGARLPLVAVVTDFFVNLYWKLHGVDMFCLAAEESKSDFVRMGGLPQKMEVTGIPIRPRFARRADGGRKAAAGSRRVVLVMGGVRGLGPMSQVAEGLCDLDGDVQVIVVTGRNKRLRRRLAGLSDRYRGRLTVLTYVDNVDELMSRSDVLISKAGGITTSESLAKKLPMVLVSPIPGQEMRNAMFLAEKGVAVLASGAEEAVKKTVGLLRDSGTLDQMKSRMAGLRRPDSSFRIVDRIVGMWKRA